MGSLRLDCRRAAGTASLRMVALLVLLVPFLGLAPAPAPVLRAQPELLAQAAAQPAARLAVIIQKTTPGTGLEALVARLGGRVTLDLHIINAFAAEVPASALATVAGADGVRWVSLDAPVVKTDCTDCVNTTRLRNAYDRAIHADQVWGDGQGYGVGVAVLDSGVNPNQDLYTPWGRSRLVASAAFNTDWNRTPFDGYGHGTHVAGIIGGNGAASQGSYIGIAPAANLINVKVSNDDGSASASSVVAGLQWINDNRNSYNIRVVNISLNSTLKESYHNSAIDAAVEILWFNKIVVVVSAGNKGELNALYPPANDPFVITVGATDDQGTPGMGDDTVASFSAYGRTESGFSKPDLVAPGTDIVSLLSARNSTIAQAHPDHIVTDPYFRMSGTSMAAPMVAGAVALLLQREPQLTPDQVKFRLMTTAAREAWPGYTVTKAGAGYLDIYAAVHTATTNSANTGTNVSRLLTTGSDPISWGSVSWNSVSWNSVSWNSVSWNSVSWNSDFWGP
ncbi:MAG TPA: S8 family peptidase [Chloroflexia bacterium]|nr:S8 family peptidase [Chloroflexia bacterium]